MPRVELDRPSAIANPMDRAPHEVTGQRLTGKVILDGVSFERCAFEDAVLVYLGGPPPSIRDCAFKGVSFEFDGAAGRTLALLQAMSAQSSGFRDIFKASFPKLFGH